MDPFATVDDVEARWRPLSAEETIVATTLLADASALLRARISTIDQQITDGDLDADLVTATVVTMVVRVLRNPDGVRQETVGDYSVTHEAGEDGRVRLTDEDLQGLSPSTSTGAFTIYPGGAYQTSTPVERETW